MLLPSLPVFSLLSCLLFYPIEQSHGGGFLLTQPRHLAPGGWIERLEVDITVRCDDGTMPLDSALATIVETFNQAAAETENSVNTADTMRSFIEGAGFINVHEKVTKTPIGPWAKHPIYKQAGGIYMISFKIGLEGYVTI